MTRRWFLGLLGIAQTPNCGAGGGDEHLMECAHTWTKGPFYVTAAKTYEEPGYYPPQVLLRIEHCTECGILRLPKDVRELNGTNMDQGHVEQKPKS